MLWRRGAGITPCNDARHSIAVSTTQLARTSPACLDHAAWTNLSQYLADARCSIPRKVSIPAAGTSSVRSLRCSVESRHLWIGVEDRAESCFQWAEPGIVVAPVFERVAVKRLLHLLGTRRGQNTLRFVKCKARFFGRHADECQEAADFGVRIQNKFLI